MGATSVPVVWPMVTSDRTPAQMAEWEQKMAEARTRRVLTNEVDRCLTVLDLFIDPDSRSWEPEMWEAVPAWHNWMGFDSMARMVDFRPIDVAHRIEKPIAYFLAEKDIVADTDSFWGAVRGHQGTQEADYLRLWSLRLV